MLQSVLNILKLGAFLPDVRNPLVPFKQRLQLYDRPLLGISLERSSAQMRILQADPADGKVTIEKAETLEFTSDNQLQDEVTAFCSKHQLEYAIGLLSYDVVMELRPIRTGNAEDDVRLLREDPRQLLGEDVETAYVYSLLRLPSNDKEALIFAYPRSAVDRLEGLAAKAPFSFLQISSGIELYLANLLSSQDHLHALSDERDLVIFDRPTLSILQFSGQKILPALLCRTDMGDLPPDESVMVINALERYLRPESQVELICLAGSESNDAMSIRRVLDDVVGADRYELKEQAHPLITLLME